MQQDNRRDAMRACLNRLIMTAMVAGAAGCTSWSRLNESRPVPTRGTVQVWSAGEEILLRDPKKMGDSLVGQAPLPDTTRRTVPLALIDSLRIQEADMGKVLIVGTGVVIAAALLYAEGLKGNAQ
jgi:hypothetical protein